eukprot:m.55448 g.55448  ORF g.55448 m.55448 type:complete len:1814 (-) comp7754_c3_seq1:283-5724(-)
MSWKRQQEEKALAKDDPDRHRQLQEARQSASDMMKMFDANLNDMQQGIGKVQPTISEQAEEEQEEQDDDDSEDERTRMMIERRRQNQTTGKGTAQVGLPLGLILGSEDEEEDNHEGGDDDNVNARKEQLHSVDKEISSEIIVGGDDVAISQEEWNPFSDVSNASSPSSTPQKPTSRANSTFSSTRRERRRSSLPLDEAPSITATPSQGWNPFANLSEMEAVVEAGKNMKMTKEEQLRVSRMRERALQASLLFETEIEKDKEVQRREEEREKQRIKQLEELERQREEAKRREADNIEQAFQRREEAKLARKNVFDPFDPSNKGQRPPSSSSRSSSNTPSHRASTSTVIQPAELFNNFEDFKSNHGVPFSLPPQQDEEAAYDEDEDIFDMNKLLAELATTIRLKFAPILYSGFQHKMRDPVERYHQLSKIGTKAAKESHKEENIDASESFLQSDEEAPLSPRSTRTPTTPLKSSSQNINFFDMDKFRSEDAEQNTDAERAVKIRALEAGMDRLEEQLRLLPVVIDRAIQQCGSNRDQIAAVKHRGNEIRAAYKNKLEDANDRLLHFDQELHDFSELFVSSRATTPGKGERKSVGRKLSSDKIDSNDNFNILASMGLFSSRIASRFDDNYGEDEVDAVFESTKPLSPRSPSKFNNPIAYLEKFLHELDELHPDTLVTVSKMMTWKLDDGLSINDFEINFQTDESCYPERKASVRRQYKEIIWLVDELIASYGLTEFPFTVPSNRAGEAKLGRFLTRIAQHDKLQTSALLHRFLFDEKNPVTDGIYPTSFSVDDMDDMDRHDLAELPIMHLKAIASHIGANVNACVTRFEYADRILARHEGKNEEEAVPLAPIGDGYDANHKDLGDALGDVDGTSHADGESDADSDGEDGKDINDEDDFANMLMAANAASRDSLHVGDEPRFLNQRRRRRNGSNNYEGDRNRSNATNRELMRDLGSSHDDTFDELATFRVETSSSAKVQTEAKDESSSGIVSGKLVSTESSSDKQHTTVHIPSAMPITVSAFLRISKLEERYASTFSEAGYDDLRVVASMQTSEFEDAGVLDPKDVDTLLKAGLTWNSQASKARLLSNWKRTLLRSGEDGMIHFAEDDIATLEETDNKKSELQQQARRERGVAQSAQSTQSTQQRRRSSGGGGGDKTSRVNEDDLKPKFRVEGDFMVDESGNINLKAGDEEVEMKFGLSRDWDPFPVLKVLYDPTKPERGVSNNEDEMEQDRFGVVAVRMEGYLEKLPKGINKKSMLKRWNRRYFRIRDGELFYYEDEKAERPSGFIHLRGAAISFRGGNLLEIHDQKNYVSMMVRTSSTQELEDWKYALDIESSSLRRAAPKTETKLQELRNTLIFDIGGCSIRAGFAETDVAWPSLYMPTCVATYNDSSGKHVYGMDALRPNVRAKARISYPFRTTDHMHDSHDFDSFEGIYGDLFQRMGVDPSDRTVILTEPHVCAQRDRSRIAEIMFETFGVPSLFMKHQSLLSMYSYGATTGVIVDIGERCDVIPLDSGYVIERGVSKLRIGGRHVTDSLSRMMSEEGHRFFSPVESYIGRLVKERVAYVSSNFAQSQDDEEAGLIEESLVDARRFAVPDGTKTFSLRGQKFRCTEGLFYPHRYGKDTGGLHDLVAKAIQASAIDVRKTLARNIYLSGGTSLLPGLAKRLESEVAYVLPQSVTVKVHAAPHRQHAAFQGGSVLAGLPNFSSMCAWLEDWHETGPDVLKRWEEDTVATYDSDSDGEYDGGDSRVVREWTRSGAIQVGEDSQDDDHDNEDEDEDERDEDEADGFAPVPSSYHHHHDSSKREETEEHDIYERNEV